LSPKKFFIHPKNQTPNSGIQQGAHLWEVDEFLGKNRGLVVAEVELSDPSESIIFPPWIGKEVTGDPRYYNSSLAVLPFSEWKPESR
jgi:adenylate cyclase